MDWVTSEVQFATGGTETLCFADVFTINLRRVKVRRVLINLVSWSKSLLTWKGPCEGNAVRTARLHVHLWVVRVTVGDQDRPAFWMGLGSTFTISTVKNFTFGAFVNRCKLKIVNCSNVNRILSQNSIIL